MAYIFAVAFGYLVGCSNMAWYIAKINKVDMRAGGSGNLGASNATVLLGWKAGIAVGVHDILKATLAVLLTELLFPRAEFVGAVAGVACVLGHIFPFWLRFKGGKGFASFIGMTLALNWKFALVVMLAVLIVTVLTDYIVCGTFTAIITVPVYLGIARHSLILAGILAVATLTIFFKHRENIPRMLNGTELGLKSAIKGENRVK